MNSPAPRVISEDEAIAAGEMKASDGTLYRDRSNQDLQWVVNNVKSPQQKVAAARTLLLYRAQQAAAQATEPAAPPAFDDDPDPTAEQVKAQHTRPPYQERPRLPAPVAGSARAMLEIPSIREQFESLLKERAGQFIASLANSLYSDKNLRAADPHSVINAALVAASLNLPIEKSLGFAYIIAYAGQAQFQMGYKGYVQLAIRSGAYQTINVSEVYEGEIKFNRFTGEVTYGERTGDKVIAYMAQLKLTNGFEKFIYSTREQVEAHAKKYSKNFYGTAKRPSIWQTEFDAMAKKTVLKDLISHWGIMSVDMGRAFQLEAEAAARDMSESDNGPQIVDHYGEASAADEAALWGEQP